ncbi:MAG: hypothetical protein HY403_09640 [Elusimicrobia bacterium]|nr:hypothetical protein [Elusimicrobiota bacterium]
MTRTRRVLAGLLAALTAASAPGLVPYQAAAAVISGAPAAGRSGTVAPVPRIGSNGAGIAPLSPAGGLASGLTGGLSALSLDAPVPLFQHSALVPTDAIPSLPVSALEFSPAAAPEGAEAADAARAKAHLAFAGERLAAVDDSKKAGVLDAFFTGVRRVYGRLGSASAAAPAAERPASAAVEGDSRAGAVAPKPLALEGRGLQPGERFLVARAGAAESAAPARVVPKPDVEGDGLPEDQQKRAIWGLTWNRFFSLLAGSIGGIAYPLMVIGAVGQAEFYSLSGLGSLAGIPLALLAGWIGDKMPLKGYTIFNVGLRAAIFAVQAAFWHFGLLSFWPLLFLTVLSTWQFSTLFSNDYALQVEIVGKDAGKIRATEALIRMTTIVVTVVAGLFLGAAAINALGYFWTFLLVAAIQMIPVLILHRTLPSTIGSGRPGLSGLWRAAMNRLRDLFSRRSAPAAGEAAKPRAWKRAAAVAALAAALVLFFVPIPGAPFLLKSPIPFVLVFGAMIWGSKSAKIIRGDLFLRTSLLFVMIGAFIEVPLRNTVLGALASETMKDPASAAAYLGGLVAAFYLGQLPSGTGMLDPKLTVTAGKIAIPFRRVMKWLGAAGVAAWTYFVLLPKEALAAAAASLAAVMPPFAAAALIFASVAGAVAAGYVALHDATPKISDEAWMRLEAGALLFMSAPLFFGLAPWSIYLALAAFGFVLNGSQRMVSATFSTQLKKLAKDKFQTVNAMRNAFFGISTAVAYTVYGLAKTIPAYWGETNAFPFTWYVIAATYAVFAFLFWRGSKVFRDSADGAAAPPERMLI